MKPKNWTISHPKTLGERLHNVRRAKGMSQRELAAKAGYEVSTIRRLEGDRNINLFTFVNICDALNVSIDYIVRGELWTTYEK